MSNLADELKKLRCLPHTGCCAPFTGLDALAAEDCRVTESAEGWLELGAWADAISELDRITPEHRAHPNVLALEWRIHAESGDWRAAYNVAQQLSRSVPDEAQPWLWMAESARHMNEGGVLRAMDVLITATLRFPDEPLIPFTCARYSCHLDRLTEAHRWWMSTLALAKRLGNDRQWKMRALREKDLHALWHAEELEMA